MGIVKDSLITAVAMRIGAGLMQRKYQGELEALRAGYASAHGLSPREAREILEQGMAEQAAKDQHEKLLQVVQRGLGVNGIRAAIYARYIERAMRENGTGMWREFRRFALTLVPMRRRRHDLFHRYQVLRRRRRMAANKNRASA